MERDLELALATPGLADWISNKLEAGEPIEDVIQELRDRAMNPPASDLIQ